MFSMLIKFYNKTQSKQTYILNPSRKQNAPVFIETLILQQNLVLNIIRTQFIKIYAIHVKNNKQQNQTLNDTKRQIIELNLFLIKTLICI